MNKSLLAKLKSGAINLALATASLCVAFLAAEIGLRLYHYGGLTWEHAHLPPLIREPDPDTGWHLAPNQEAAQHTLDYQLVVETNSHGLRGPERAAGPDPEATTIVVLGDSFMEAAHVPADSGFCPMLESTAGPGNLRVINLGVGGFSTVQAWQQFKARGRDYEPDLVLLAFYAENDVYGNVAGLTRMMWGEDEGRYFSAPFASLGPASELVLQPPQYERAVREYESARKEYSPFWMRMDAMTDSIVEAHYKRALSKFRQKVHRPGDEMAIHLGVYANHHLPPEEESLAEFESRWEDAFQVTGAVIRELRDDVEASGAALAIFSVPSKLQTLPVYREIIEERFPALDLDFDRPHRQLAGICDDAGIPFLDLLPDFRQATSAGEVLFHQIEDSHWNAAGHAFAAARVGEWLAEERLLQADGIETADREPSG